MTDETAEDDDPLADVPDVEPPTDHKDLIDDVRAIVSDGGEDIDPKNPRPEGHYPRFDGNTWHYVPDELAQTISLRPGGDGEDGQDWILFCTPARRDQEDFKKVFVWLTPGRPTSQSVTEAFTADSPWTGACSHACFQRHSIPASSSSGRDTVDMSSIRW